VPARSVAITANVPSGLASALQAIRTDLGIPGDFPAEVLTRAEAVARRPGLPELDRTDLGLITIDPEGARDLDQAIFIARAGSGFVISYAIADLAAFLTTGDPIDAEARRRGVTLYAPDHRTPLYPPVLSEDAASLLPGELRPALLWTIRLDSRGAMLDAEVTRARVRSREQLSYSQAQAELDGGRPRETLALLAEVGRWRQRRERERGGVSLDLPQQEVRTAPNGWSLAYRTPLPVEGWNAQISLLSGMAAAHLMMYGQVGILRTVPPAEHESLRRLHQVARALRIAWPAELDYPEFVRSLDPARPAHAAMLNACSMLFRGAGYRAFSGSIPDDVEHAALAIEYAHATAPLRRRVDRYAGEICVALCSDSPIPEWVLAALDSLPAEMRAAEQRAKRYERAIIDLLEVFVLAGRSRETFTGTVVEVDRGRDRGMVLIKDPAVEGTVLGRNLPLGRDVDLRLVSAGLGGGVQFELA